MRFQIGDLVSERQGPNLGVIVEINKANSSSLMSSIHSSSLVKNSFDIYYVFFSSAGKINGPYYPSELSLKNGIT